MMMKKIDYFLCDKKINMEFNLKNEIILNGENIEKKIRNLKISKYASIFSQNKNLKNFLIKKQKKIVKKKGFVLDGRDTTFRVAPNSKIKIYLDCEINERVKRRMIQFKIDKKNFEKVKCEILERDKRDKIENIKNNKDLILIDTSNLKIKEQVDKIFYLVEKKFFLK